MHNRTVSEKRVMNCDERSAQLVSYPELVAGCVCFSCHYSCFLLTSAADGGFDIFFSKCGPWLEHRSNPFAADSDRLKDLDSKPLSLGPGRSFGLGTAQTNQHNENHSHTFICLNKKQAANLAQNLARNVQSTRTLIGTSRKMPRSKWSAPLGEGFSGRRVEWTWRRSVKPGSHQSPFRTWQNMAGRAVGLRP